MAVAEGAVFFSVASVMEDVLQQHGTRLRDLDLESRKAEEAASRRYEAAGWLRKMVGVVAAKDLPAEPSGDEFRLGLRSGIILCNALNKVEAGAVPKVVESPCDATLIPDGAALSAFQYFENVRNFLVALQEMGLPTFEASDLEQGGEGARVVNSILALKSYNEWKQSGGNGVCKFGGNVKPIISGKTFIRKNTEPFMNSLSRNSLMNEKSLNVLSSDLESNKMPNSGSLSMLVRAILFDKKPEEVPLLMESVLSKVAKEFEKRVPSRYEQAEDKKFQVVKKEECFHKNHIIDKKSETSSLKQQMILDKQHTDTQELKHTLHTMKGVMQFMQIKVQEEFNILGMHVNGLAHAASRYNRVLEENRKLYNQVQDLKGSIRVYCRVRPILSGQSYSMSSVDHIGEETITIVSPSKNGKGLKSFTFNKVFEPSATQAEVFSDMQPLIRSVLDGYNVCIFAYGQTGSGKTYTMTGPKDHTEKNKGVNYRALSDLFLLAEQRKDIFHYDIAVQMIEIYNEQVRDLLVVDASNKRLEIRNSSQTGLNVPDANLVPVSSTSDVVDVMNLGHRNRAVGATALNDRSSRSHSCLTVHVQGRDLTSGTVLRGCMNLVDLAGSERVDKSEATGDRLKEAQHINKSLSALGDVIASLAQKNAHVPYRNSKLTQLLQDSIGGQAKTLMFVHISPELDSIGETISTLKFAERVSTVELGAARVNKDSADIKELKEQIASLKAALARKEGESDHNQHSVSGISEKCKLKTCDSSPMICRPAMDDVGNIEVPTNSSLRQKKQSFDLDELLANSPPWPPVTSAGQTYEEEKEIGSGEWVDKVMVNKQDEVRIQNPLGSRGADNGHLPDDFCHKSLTYSSRLYSEQSFMFAGSNQFITASTDDMDDLDTATSDSSEPDLLWQFNQSKLSSLSNGIQPKAKKLNSKAAKSSELRMNLNTMVDPSPSRKLANGVGVPLNRNGRQLTQADGKRRTGMRK